MGKSSRMKRERKESVKGITVWHYTTSAHIQSIFDSGALKPTAIRIDEGERPALWFSSNTDWERTVSKRIKVEGKGVTPALQRDDLFKAGITPIRIQVDASAIHLMDWKKFKKTSGIRLRTSIELEEKGKLEGADPSEWYATYDSVPLDKWISIGFWTEKGWVDHNLEDYYAMKQEELLQQIG